MEVSHRRILFLFEVKLRYNVAQAAKNLNKVFGGDTVKDWTVSDGSKALKIPIRRYESRKGNAWTRRVIHLKQHIVSTSCVWSSLNCKTHATSRTLSAVSRYLHALGNVKSLDKCVHQDFTEQSWSFDWKFAIWGQKLSVFQQSWDMWQKVAYYDISSMTCMVLDADETTKRMPKPIRNPKKVIVTFSWCTRDVIYISFLESSEYINEEK